VEGLEVKKLGFNGGMEGFNVGVGIGPCRRVEAVASACSQQRAVEAIGAIAAGVPIKLGAQVGAHFHFGQWDPEAAQVFEQAGAGERRIGF